MNKLPTYKGYTVDFKLQEFRKVLLNKKCKCLCPILDFILFKSEKGDQMLGEMIEKDIVPKEILQDLF